MRLYPRWVDTAATEMGVGPAWLRPLQRFAFWFLWVCACLVVGGLLLGATLELVLLFV